MQNLMERGYLLSAVHGRNSMTQFFFLSTMIVGCLYSGWIPDWSDYEKNISCFWWRLALCKTADGLPESKEQASLSRGAVYEGGSHEGICKWAQDRRAFDQSRIHARGNEAVEYRDRGLSDRYGRSEPAGFLPGRLQIPVGRTWYFDVYQEYRKHYAIYDVVPSLLVYQRLAVNMLLQLLPLLNTKNIFRQYTSKHAWLRDKLEYGEKQVEMCIRDRSRSYGKQWKK